MTRLQVLGLSGSPAKDGNTETLVKAILEAAMIGRLPGDRLGGGTG